MAKTYYPTTTNSDVTRTGYDWVKTAETSAGSGTNTMTCAPVTEEYTSACTVSGEPGFTAWTDGNWSVATYMHVNSEGNGTLDVELYRINSTGTAQEGPVASNEGAQTITDDTTLTHTFTNVTWTDEVDTDRIEVRYIWYNNHTQQNRNYVINVALSSITTPLEAPSTEIAGAVTLGGVEVSGAGENTKPASGDVTLGGVESSGSAIRGLHATSAAACGGIAVASSATVGRHAAGAASLGGVTVAGAASSQGGEQTATSTVSLGAVEADAWISSLKALTYYKHHYWRIRVKDVNGVVSAYSNQGDYFRTGNVVSAASLGGVATSGSANRTLHATGAASLGGVATAGQGTKGKTATSAVALGAVTATGDTQKTRYCTGAVSLGAVAAASTATIGRHATSSASLGAVTATGDTQRTRYCAGAASIGALSASANITKSGVKTATGAVTLGAIESAGNIPSGQPLTYYKQHYWRIRVKDTNGIVSAYSAQGDFFRTGNVTSAVALGALIPSGQASKESAKTATGAVSLGSVATSGYASPGAAVLEYNSTYYWRIQVRDTNSIESPFTTSGDYFHTTSSKVAVGTVSLRPVESSGAASNVHNITGAVTLGGITAASGTNITRNISGDVALGAISADAEARSTWHVTSAVSLGGVNVAGQIWPFTAKLATGAVSLGAMTTSATEQRGKYISSAVSLGGITAQGDTLRTVNSIASANLGSITLSGAAERGRKATGNVTLGSVEFYGRQKVNHDITGAVTLGSIAVWTPDVRSPDRNMRFKWELYKNAGAYRRPQPYRVLVGMHR